MGIEMYPERTNSSNGYSGDRHIAAARNTAVVQTENLSYKYDVRKHVMGSVPLGADGIISEREKVLLDASFQVERGARMLVVGGNGAGKSTLLSIIGGRKMVPPAACLVLGRPCFHDTRLTQNVAYLGEWWTTDFYLNCRVRELLTPAQLESPHVAKVAEALAVNLEWIVNRVSDGQRRRSQLLIALADPKDVYILDEVTTDLDVIARDRLLELLRLESERGATVMYATHIFDNLDGWASHIMRVHQGEVTWCSTLGDCTPYQQHVEQCRIEGNFNPLYRTVRDWVQGDWDARDAQLAKAPVPY